jgi:hypothetical protein
VEPQVTGAGVTPPTNPVLVPAAEQLVGPADQPSNALPRQHAPLTADRLPKVAEQQIARVAQPIPAPATGATPPGRIAWLESGVGLMVLPVTLTVVAIVAPMLWLMETRAKH